jgi:NAD(P)H dehydrogenase (quinone)
MGIVVTGASGQLGGAVVRLLAKRIPASELILVSRNPDACAPGAPAGAQVRYGDFDRPETLRAAFSGGDRALIVSTLDVGRRWIQHAGAIAAARAAGIEHLVYTSLTGASADNPCTVVADHLRTEATVRASGIPFTIMRHAFYSETLLGLGMMMWNMGEWLSATGEGRCSFVCRDDCAECLAIVLTTPGHEHKTYNITGPELLTMHQVLDLILEAYRVRLPYRDVSLDVYDARLAAAGIPEEHRLGPPFQLGRRIFVSNDHAIRDGFFAICSEDARRLLGRAPVSLREFFRAQAMKLLATS